MFRFFFPSKNDLLGCDPRCPEHGFCDASGSCECFPGWNGRHCTLEGCPGGCGGGGRGQCIQVQITNYIKSHQSFTMNELLYYRFECV